MYTVKRFGRRLIAWAAIGAASALNVPAIASQHTTWAVDYSDDATAAELLRYDVLVLDADRHPPLGPLLEHGRQVLAYLSLAEVHKDRAYFAKLSEARALGAENANWSGSFSVDLRSPRWREIVLEELVPEALRRGFSGIFLDTVDTAIHLEITEPTANAGMTRATVELIKAIRHNYPHITLMQNRGYPVAPQVANHLDILLGESVRSTYDFTKQSYVPVSDADYEYQRQALLQARARNPQLQLFTLDYWEPEDQDAIAHIYAEQRRNGFVPYVSVIQLDRIVAEPRL